MHIGVLKNSNFLKKDDVDPAILVTIRELTQENVAKEGAPQELKWCMHFEELEKPLVLNSTNAQIAARIIGSEETDDWAGKQVVLYNDPNVSFQGKMTGGIRLREHRKAPAKLTGKPEKIPALEKPEEFNPEYDPF